MDTRTREQRYNSAAEGIFSIELEGYRFTDEELNIISRYVEGEIDMDEVQQLFFGEKRAVLR